MKQDLKKLDEKQDDLADIRKEFNKPKATKRTVTLFYQECCGCGCTSVEIERDVPIDSEYKDGDEVYALESGDRMVEDND